MVVTLLVKLNQEINHFLLICTNFLIMKKLLFYASAVAVLFSSCSKDATEDIAINKAGNEVFSVSLNTEEESTTRVTLSGSTFVWDVNDAIGVATTEALDANIMVSTSIGGTAPKFSVSEEDYTRWLDDVATTANPLMVYFPYKPETKFAADGKLTVNIPAKQRYAHESFYKNAIHAVGYAPEYTGADQEIALHVPHGFIQAKVVGWGDMKSITLSIKDKNGNDVNLTGNYEVDALPEYTEEDGYATDHKYITAEKSGETYGKEITVDLGFKPENLLFSDPLLVNFVVPAGIKLSEATLTFTNDKGDTYYVKMNKEASAGKMDMRPGLRVTVSQNVQFGLDDKFLIVDDDQYTAEEKFLAYAYMAQVQTADSKPYEGVWDFVKAYVPNASSVYDVDALIVDTELDFAAYDKAWADAGKAELDKKLVYNATNEFWSNVYAWYSKNGGAIESLAYNTVLGDSNTTIKNLNVVGTGISQGAGLENLTIENVTVKAKNCDTAGLIAGLSYNAEVKDVVISTGNKVVAEGVAQVGGVYGRLYTADAAYATAEPIAIEAKNCEFVGRLYGRVIETIELTLAEFEWDASVAAYPVIGNLKEGASVYADVAIDASMKNAGVVGMVDVEADNQKASSVVVEGVSYWNGDCDVNDGAFIPAKNDGTPDWTKFNEMVAAANAEEKSKYYFTAEDFAAIVSDANNSSMFLNVNIDMQGDHMASFIEDEFDGMLLKPEFTLTFEADRSGRKGYTVNGNNFTIANINIAAEKVSTSHTYIALFGQNPTIKNVKISGLTISNDNISNNFSISGLGYSGVAENVTVENVNIQTVYAPSYKGAGIGAIFATVDANNIKNVSVKDCVISAPEQNVAVGYVAGVLTLSEKLVSIAGINVSGDNFVQSAAKGLSAKAGRVNTSYAANTQYAYAGVPFGVVNVTCAAFSEAGTVQNKLTVTDSSYGDTFAAGYWFAHYDEAKKDVTLSKTAFADITKYDYVFTSNANANNYFNNIAFDWNK